METIAATFHFIGLILVLIAYCIGWVLMIGWIAVTAFLIFAFALQFFISLPVLLLTWPYTKVRKMRNPNCEQAIYDHGQVNKWIGVTFLLGLAVQLAVWPGYFWYDDLQYGAIGFLIEN